MKKTNLNTNQALDKAQDKAGSAVKKGLTPKALAIIITASVLLVVILATSIFLIVDAVNSDEKFDYLTSDLSKYVEISEDDYKNYKLTIDFAGMHDRDVDIAMMNIIAQYKGDVVDEGTLSTKYTVYPGDTVQIWYRGYIFDEDGNEIAVDGMSNFANSAPVELEIGSGDFIPGFEYDLVGKSPKNTARFEKITSGAVTGDNIVYVSFSRIVNGGDEDKDTVTGTNVRIDLADTTIDETYGAGFRDTLLAAEIGTTLEFSVTMDGDVYNYSSTKINFATNCEKADNIIKVNCYFPYSYGTTGSSTANLRNENAQFEVYIQYVQHYELPEGVEWDSENNTYVISDSFIEMLVDNDSTSVTMEQLDEYEGETLVEKYYNFAAKALEDAYEEEYKALVETAMWEHLYDKAVIKKYPQSKVEEIYEAYVEDVHYQYQANGGYVTDKYTGIGTTYDNVDDYAIAYLGLTYSPDKDWKSVLYTMSKELVAERLILYYLIREIDGLMPTEEELSAKVEEIKLDYLNEYVVQYLSYLDKTREDYTEEEYEEFLVERATEIFAYYDDAHFTETAYYEIALETLMTYPEVSTLEDRRAYPFDK